MTLRPNEGGDGTQRGSLPYRLLRTVSLDAGLVLLVAILVGGLALVPLLALAGDVTDPAAWRMCQSWELRLSIDEVELALPLLHTVRERVATEEFEDATVELVRVDRHAPSHYFEVLTENDLGALSRRHDLEGADSATSVGLKVCPFSAAVPAGEVVAASGLRTGTIFVDMWPWLEPLSYMARTVLKDRDLGSALEIVSGILPFAATSGALGLLVGALYLRRRRPTPEWEEASIGAYQAAGLGVGLGLLGFGGAYLLAVAQNALGLPAAEQPWIEALAARGGVGLALLAVGAVTVAPVAEELFFRGHIFRYLAAHGAKAWAYLFSVGLFAALHFNLSGLVVYIWLGLLLAWSYNRWRRPLVPIVTHVTANAAALTLLVLVSRG